MNKKIFLLLLFSLVFINLFGDSYLENDYYIDKVQTIKTELSEIDLIENVEILSADNPYPFVPDLFEVKIVLKNGDVLLLKHVQKSLKIYQDLTSISSLNDFTFFSASKKYSSTRIAFKYLGKEMGIKIDSLQTFFENYTIIREYLIGLPKFSEQEKPSKNHPIVLCRFN